MNQRKKDPSRGASESTHREQLPRLRRIEGQVRGLQQMIDNERGCLDITQQISATMNALRRVQVDMLQKHIALLGAMAATDVLSCAERQAITDEMARHLKKLT